MVTPKEISAKEWVELYNKYYVKACRYEKAANRTESTSYWFSSAFKPCSGYIKTTNWKYYSPEIIRHFTHTPCDEYCSEKLPMAACLVKSYEGKFYYCHHKVGNCPWKK
jgi:hypothetical protein